MDSAPQDNPVLPCRASVAAGTCHRNSGMHKGPVGALQETALRQGQEPHLALGCVARPQSHPRDECAK